MGGRTTMLPDDLPEDMPSFLARFGSDEQCREYLFKVRWPDGFRCAACGHGEAYALRTKIVYECVACRKQHSLLAGTIFEQTKTGLSRWFLAIYLVTSSKGGIAAAELKRQLGLGSYQTAWSWLHKLRKAMVRPDREPLAGRVEADESYVGGPRPGKRAAPGRGGPWPCGACAASSRRSGSCRTRVAAAARRRRCRPCSRSPGRWPGTSAPGRSWSARRGCRRAGSAACRRPCTRRRGASAARRRRRARSLRSGSRPASVPGTGTPDTVRRSRTGR